MSGSNRRHPARAVVNPRGAVTASAASLMRSRSGFGAVIARCA
jgi:hypothetical protein